jgi:two-component system phosphate regulon sensor histidine kinase PhoR
MAKEKRTFPINSEHILTTPDGNRITLEFTTTLDSDKSSIVSVFKDISKIKELEKLRADFIDTISHELRTPLTSIKGYISTLLHPRANFKQEEITDFLKIINEEANRLNRMINDLLESSKLQKDALEVKLQPVEITGIINELLKKRQARTTIHTFVTDFEFQGNVIADSQQIQFVLNHLIENAIKFSPDGGKILISTSSTNEDNATVMIEDQGIGIPDDQKDKIFDMFHRVDNRSTRKIYGPGLGLYIARKIIEAHGKNIWVESGLKGGTKFVFNLSRCNVDSE